MRKAAFVFLAIVLLGALPSQGFSAVSFPGGKDVTVNADTDVYDKPQGEVIGKLEKGRIVAIFECRDDQWCSISGGWVLGLAPTSGGGGGGGGGDQATAPNGTTIYKQPNGDESEANVAGYVDQGGSVTVTNCADSGFCKVSAPYKGYVWHEDIGR
jgi:SH3-like domain-containing protein